MTRHTKLPLIIVAMGLLLFQCARTTSTEPQLPVTDTPIAPGIERTQFELRNLSLAPDGSVYGSKGQELFRIVPGGRSAEPVAVFEHRINAIHVTRSGVHVVATDNDHFNPSKPATVLVAKNGDGPYRESLHIAGGSALAWSIDSNQRGRIFVGEYGPQQIGMSKTVWATDDDGVTWQAVFQADNRDGVHIHRVAADPESNSLWVSVGDGSDNRGVYIAEDSDNIDFERALDSQATAIEFSKDYIYLGEDTRRRPGVSFVDRDDTRSAASAVKFKSHGNYGGSVYDMTIGAEGLVYAPTMKYHNESHVAALWVGQERKWRVVMLFASADGVGGGRETIAGPDRDGYIYLTGYKIHDATVMNYFNEQ